MAASPSDRPKSVHPTRHTRRHRVRRRISLGSEQLDRAVIQPLASAFDLAQGGAWEVAELRYNISVEAETLRLIMKIRA